MTHLLKMKSDKTSLWIVATNLCKTNNERTSLLKRDLKNTLKKCKHIQTNTRTQGQTNKSAATSSESFLSFIFSFDAAGDAYVFGYLSNDDAYEADDAGDASDFDDAYDAEDVEDADDADDVPGLP